MEDIPFVSVTKDTPKEDAIRLGECPEARECMKCSKLCTMGSGALADEDIPKLAKHLGVTEENLKKEYLEEIEKYGTIRYKPKLIREGKKHYGECIFFNPQEKCTIHAAKPLECKISTCTKHGESLSEWFMLNYFVNPNNPQSIRDWAIRLKTHPTIPGGKPEDMIKDKKKLAKIMSYEILR